jgi:hypothetical protein
MCHSPTRPYETVRNINNLLIVSASAQYLFSTDTVAYKYITDEVSIVDKYKQ